MKINLGGLRYHVLKDIVKIIIKIGIVAWIDEPISRL